MTTGPLSIRLWRRAYGAQIVVKGLQSSDCGDRPRELRLWRRAYGAQIVVTGLQSSDCGDGPTELSSAQNVARAYGVQIRLITVPAITTLTLHGWLDMRLVLEFSELFQIKTLQYKPLS